MKKKLTTKITAVCLVAALLATGCGESESGSNDSDKTKTQEGTNTVSVGKYGANITVADIKQQYDAEDTSVMPLYNVAEDEAFEFNFKADLEDEYIVDIVTVHADKECKEESIIYTYQSITPTESGSTVKITPVSGVLLNDTQEEEYLEEDKAIWGNAPIYYISINYDMEADTLVKLDNPIIIPFTVRQEVEVPNVKGVVDSTGRFKLTWDAVEGATEYRIYKLLDSSQWTGDSNEPVSGAKFGYNECSLIADGITTETEWDNFSGDGGHSIAVHERSVSGKEYIIGQNYSVSGEYYVSAVVDGKESGFCGGISTAQLNLPFRLTDECDIMFNEYESVDDLPLTLDVLNVDGSVTSRKVLYTYQTQETYTGAEMPEYRYEIEGTAITGCVSMFVDDPSTLPQTVGEESSSGSVEPENNIKKTPDSDVETIIRPDDKKNTDDNSPTDDPGAAQAPSDTPLVEDQMDNTKKHLEIADDDSVANPGKDICIFADSAEEEWIALNMVNANTEISLEGFPSLQDPTTLSDVIYKVYYQNPYVLGLYQFAYDYSNMTLKIEYLYDAETIADKQGDITEAADKIISDIITDGMSDDDKRLAIYTYLEDNCEYDNDALEGAKNSGYVKTQDSTYEDSFNVYGILVNNKGVCQSYAYAYKLLAYDCGLDCRIITGYLDGNLPHAWNIVQVDGGWYQVDATNNGKTTGIPYFLYNADTDTAAITGYTMDELFELDENISSYETDNDTYEYYYSRDMVAGNVEEYKGVLDEILTSDAVITCVRYYGEAPDIDELVSAVREVYNKHGLEDKLATLQYANMNGYLILLEGAE